MKEATKKPAKQTKPKTTPPKDNGKHPGGRPPLYTNPQELEARIKEYFNQADKRTATIVTKLGEVIEIPAPVYTVSGLALSLGMSTDALRNYQAKDEFIGPITRAKQLIEDFAETKLYEMSNSKGPQFVLQNLGWREKVDVEHSGKIDSSVTIIQEI